MIIAANAAAERATEADPHWDGVYVVTDDEFSARQHAGATGWSVGHEQALTIYEGAVGIATYRVWKSAGFYLDPKEASA